MFSHRPFKTLFRIFLAASLMVSVAVEPLFSAKKLSSGIVLPGAPIGLSGKLGRLGLKMFAGAGLGMLMESINPLPGRSYGSSKSGDVEIYQPLQSYPLIGLLAGLTLGLWQWNDGSANKRLELFNSLYNSFLINPVLERDISLTVLVNQAALGEQQSFWALVRIADILDVVIEDLVEVLAFGWVLKRSSLVQGLGDAEFESLVSKINHLQDMLEFARFRRDVIVNYPSYGVQKEFYKRYSVFMQQHHSLHESVGFDAFWDQWQVEQIAQRGFAEDVPGVQLPLVEASDCSICGLMVPQEKRYAMRCACRPGRHFFHHSCVSKALQINNSTCFRCKRPATVHAAFDSAEWSVRGSPVQQEEPVVPPVIHAPSPRSRCALCRGVILRDKAYKTTCSCHDGDFFYHHDCIKTHLASSADCPKCHTLNPEGHSDFNDNFQAPATSGQPEVPIVHAADEFLVCGMCGGKIVAKKLYKTRCACKQGQYYYHHLCIADTLKKTGDHCPKCFKEKTTVHSAF